MKTFAFASALLVAFAGASEAACSKKSLNGTWSVSNAGMAYQATMAGGSMSFNFGITPVVITVNSMSKSSCKGTGTISINGVSAAATFAAEHIGSSSSRKPNHLVANTPSGGSNVQFALHRK